MPNKTKRPTFPVNVSMDVYEAMKKLAKKGETTISAIADASLRAGLKKKAADAGRKRASKKAAAQPEAAAAATEVH